MTLPAPIPPVAPAPPIPPAIPVGVLARLKLTEPVRLYCYSVALVILVGLNLAGYLSGEWLPYAESSAAVVLGVSASAEAARASVYSPRSTLQAIRAATNR